MIRNRSAKTAVIPISESLGTFNLSLLFQIEAQNALRSLFAFRVKLVQSELRFAICDLKTQRFAIAFFWMLRYLIDFLMGLFGAAVFHHCGVLANSLFALMVYFPSLMGRFPASMGRFPECLNGPFSLLTTSWRTAHDKKSPLRGSWRYQAIRIANLGSFLPEVFFVASWSLCKD